MYVTQKNQTKQNKNHIHANILDRIVVTCHNLKKNVFFVLSKSRERSRIEMCISSLIACYSRDKYNWKRLYFEILEQFNGLTVVSHRCLSKSLKPLGFKFNCSTFTHTLSGSHPCATNNGLCSDLCLLKPHGGYQCTCPTGTALKPDGKTCDYGESMHVYFKMS